MKALILAGGYGLRLRPLTEELPKPLIPIKGKSILEWQIEYLKKYGISEIILAISYKKEKIIEKIGSGEKYGITVYYTIEDFPRGTGGAIKLARGILDKEEFFLVMNGDIITNINLKEFINKFKEEKERYIGGICLVKLKTRYGIVELRGNKIIRFIEKPYLNHWINGGIYIFTPEIFKYLPDKGDLEKLVFPKIAEEGKLMGIKFENVMWKSIETIKDLKEVENIL